MATSLLSTLGSSVVNQTDRHTPSLADRHQRSPDRQLGQLGQRVEESGRSSPGLRKSPSSSSTSSQDMSRRKQRNPKSLVAPAQSDLVKQEPQDTDDLDDEPRDVSNLVKVELEPSDDEHNTSSESLTGQTSPRVPSVEDVMRKWNMFQFGEVTVPNHPTVPVVPMALQMVYLYPMGRGECGEVKYKMLVPMNAASSPPLFPSQSPPLLHLNLPSIQPRSPVQGYLKRTEDDIKQSPPLDLTNKSPEHPGVQNKEDDISKKSFGIESHFNLLKMKELELLKSPPVNRCNECNINFSKYQNYLAHKKYYCSGVKQQQAQEQEEQETKPQIPKCKSPRSSSTSPSEQQGSGREQQQLLNKELLARELLMKQQEALLAGMKSPQLPLLMQNSRMPNPLQSTSHFGCEGCGISFKSISNLQAHQSRYCAGIKKSEEMKFLDALMKSGQFASGAASGGALVAPAGPVSPSAVPGNSVGAQTALSEMLALLSARKRDLDLEKDRKAERPAADKSGVEGGESDEVFCKICGLKESREKLIDHVYVHLIGQVKKRKIDEDIAVENEIEPEKKIKMEPEQEPKTIEPEKEKKDAIKCENCGIVFSKMAAYSAHAEFYCQKRLKKE